MSRSLRTTGGVALLVHLGGCGLLGGGIPKDAPCSAEMHTTGAVALDWGSDTEFECEGYGPWADDSIDLYIKNDFDSLRVRLDYVHTGDTGTFDDYFVAVAHQDDEWGSFDDLGCTVTLDRNEEIGRGKIGFKVWATAGTVSCEGPLTGFQSDGAVEIGEVRFEAWYQQANSN